MPSSPDEGRLTETIDMVPGWLFFNIPAGQWHFMRPLESATMLLECVGAAGGGRHIN